MTREQTLVSLRWPGIETLKAALAAIRSGHPVELQLPLEVHYALFKHLHPGRPHTPSEDVDALGGAELLAPIASVAGLEDLEQLQAAVRRARYHLRLTSPDPVLRLIPPER